MFTKKETDFCKGLAAVMLLMHHLFYQPETYAGYKVSTWPFTEGQLTFCAVTAKLCVAMFIFLTGYGIAATYRKNFEGRVPGPQEIWNFTWRRYWKLMSGYWFVFLLTLLAQPLGRTVVQAYGKNAAKAAVSFGIDFMGLSGLFDTATLNPTWWYITLATVAVFVFPAVMRMIQTAGPGVPLALFLLYAYLLGIDDTPVYLAIGLAGIFCHEMSVFDKMDRLWGRGRAAVAAKAFLELALLAVLAVLRIHYNYYRFMDILCVICIAHLTHSILFRIPVLTDAVQFLGRNSMNIFLLHNQLYSMYFKDFFYSLRHWAVILCALLAVSLGCSVIIEKLKKLLHYSDFMEKTGRKFLL